MMDIDQMKITFRIKKKLRSVALILSYTTKGRKQIDSQSIFLPVIA